MGVDGRVDSRHALAAAGPAMKSALILWFEPTPPTMSLPMRRSCPSRFVPVNRRNGALDVEAMESLLKRIGWPPDHVLPKCVCILPNQCKEPLHFWRIRRNLATRPSAVQSVIRAYCPHAFLFHLSIPRAQIGYANATLSG